MIKRIGLAAILVAVLLPAEPVLAVGPINGDPYGNGCIEDAVTLVTQPMGFNLYPFGELQLRMSPSCGTVWGEVYFSAPDPEENITILTEQLDRPGGIPPLELSPYSQPAKVSPVYGLMLLDEGCIRIRADVSGYYRSPLTGELQHGSSSQKSELADIQYNCASEVPVSQAGSGQSETSTNERGGSREVFVEVREVIYLPGKVTVAQVPTKAKAPSRCRKQHCCTKAKHHGKKAVRCKSTHRPPQPKREPIMTAEGGGGG